jgi:anti-anti-sigma factor
VYSPKPSVSVVVLPAAEYDLAVKDELLQLIRTAANADVGIIDLSNVTYMDSTALSCFAVLQKAMSAHGGFVVFANAGRAVKKLFMVAGFDKVYPMYHSVAEAKADVERPCLRSVRTARLEAHDGGPSR